jgi:hypothetical protein
MRDIYHQLLKHSPDFERDLTECRDQLGDGVFAITSALTLIGNLVLDATDSEGGSNEDARRDLVLMGNASRHLPRMAQALEQSANTAHYVLNQRREASNDQQR